MKIKQLNQSLTLVANFGVLIGLFFLVYEIRQNTLQIRSQASYSINEGLAMMNAGVYSNPILADIIVRGEEDFSALNETERMQFQAFQFSRINLAVFIIKLENEGVAGVHFNFINSLVRQYHTKPGLQAFAVSLTKKRAKDNGWLDLYEKLILKK